MKEEAQEVRKGGSENSSSGNEKVLFRQQAVQSQYDLSAGFLFEGFRILRDVYQGKACQRIGRPFTRVKDERLKGMAFPARKAGPLPLYRYIQTMAVMGAHDLPVNLRRAFYRP
jgi:hypothetical protein